jgi:hypothetical protein
MNIVVRARSAAEARYLTTLAGPRCLSTHPRGAAREADAPAFDAPYRARVPATRADPLPVAKRAQPTGFFARARRMR